MLNHAPVSAGGSLLWLAPRTGVDTEHAWVGVPNWRLGGLYSPANAQFRSKIVTLPAQPLLLNADCLWPGITDAAAQCDDLQELCQAYIMVEVVDPATGVPLPGYGASDCVIQNQDDTQIPLRWRGGRDTVPLAGRAVQLRFTLRDAVIYSLHASTM